MGKKQWQKPALVSLVRSNPEEAVLAACKSGLINGPTIYYFGCYMYWVALEGCGACGVHASS